MARTLLNGVDGILAASVTRSLLNTQTSGSAVITKAIAGSNVTLSQTGADAGTGDVTINVSSFPVGSLTGSTLPSNITSSSLTAFGNLGGLQFVGGGAFVGMNLTYNAGWKYIGADYGYVMRHDGSDLGISVAASGTAGATATLIRSITLSGTDGTATVSPPFVAQSTVSISGATTLSSTAGGTLLTVGARTASDTTPTAIAMDNSFSSVAGANLKFKLYSTTYGLGVSSNQLDVVSGGNTAFWASSTKVGSFTGTASFNILPTTASTSSTTGALTVGGGAGIAGALNVGGAAAVTGTTTLGGSVAMLGSLLGTSSISLGNLSCIGLTDGNGILNIVAGGYQAASSGAYEYVSTRGAARFQLHDGVAAIYTGGSTGTANATIPWTQVASFTGGTSVWLSARGTSSDLYVNNSGQVGINNSSPAYPLDVTGVIRTSSAPILSALTGLVKANGSSAATAVNLVQASVAVTAANTLAALPSAYAGLFFLLIVNGQVIAPVGASPPFTVSGTTVTWSAANAGFALATTDVVTVLYI